MPLFLSTTRHSSQNRAVYPKCFAEIAKTCNFVTDNRD